MTGDSSKEHLMGSLLGAMFWVLIGVSSGFAGDLSIDGYIKNFAVVYEFPDFRLSQFTVDPPPVGAVSNRLRLEARWRASRCMAAAVAYDLDPRIQDPALFATQAIVGTVSRSYRMDDLSCRLYPDESDRVSSFGLYQNLDRAQIEIRLGLLDLYMGRQAIAWGVARVINPTDILTPFSYAALDTEDRIGVDALRARLPIGFMSELDAGIVAGENFRSAKSAAYLRYKTYVAETDLAAIVVGFREHLMAGFEMTRAIGGAGAWVETAHVWPELLQPRADIRTDGYWRISVGADYSLSANTYGFIEYHYNQPGASDPSDYLTLISGMSYSDGAVYLLGEHYLVPYLSHEVSALVTAAGELLWNLSDGSAYLTVSLEYNLAEDVYLAGGGFIGVGSGPVRPGRIESEFGTYPDTFYSSFRFYF